MSFLSLSGDWWWRCLYGSVSVIPLNTIELYTYSWLKWYILYYAYFTIITTFLSLFSVSFPKQQRNAMIYENWVRLNLSEVQEIEIFIHLSLKIVIIGSQNFVWYPVFFKMEDQFLFQCYAVVLCILIKIKTLTFFFWEEPNTHFLKRRKTLRNILLVLNLKE